MIVNAILEALAIPYTQFMQIMKHKVEQSTSKSQTKLQYTENTFLCTSSQNFADSEYTQLRKSNIAPVNGGLTNTKHLLKVPSSSCNQPKTVILGNVFLLPTFFIPPVSSVLWRPIANGLPFSRNQVRSETDNINLDTKKPHATANIRTSPNSSAKVMRKAVLVRYVHDAMGSSSWVDLKDIRI